MVSTKPLSVLQLMLQSILLPMLAVVISISVILPILVTTIMGIYGYQQSKAIVSEIQTNISEFQSYLSNDNYYHNITGYLSGEVSRATVYQDLYQFVNGLDYPAEFYFGDGLSGSGITNFNNPAAASALLNLVNKRLLTEDTSVMLSISSVNADSGSIYFAQAVPLDGINTYFLVFDLNFTTLSRIVGTKDATIIVSNGFDRVLFSNNSKLTPPIRPNIETKLFNLINYENQSFIKLDFSISQKQLYLTTLLNIDFIVQLSKVLIFGLIIAVFFVGYGFYLIRKKYLIGTFEVIDEMFDSLSTYRKTNELRLLEDKNDHMTEYVKHYNSLLLEVKQLIEKNSLLAEKTNLAQIKQLQSQFNPHFLFNTLASINVMVEIDQEKASLMIVKLAQMLRYSIRFGEENKVLLEDDLMYIEDYLNLQQLRFGELLKYEIVCEDGNFLVPKLILQPIIENSIVHGFDNQHTFLVAVNIFQIDQDLIMVVKDNGIGMSSARLDELRDIIENNESYTKYVGLLNTNQRLQLLYGTDYGVGIDSIEHIGTVVTIRLKAERGEYSW